MRKRAEIEQDGARADLLALEVLLDIRDLLNKQTKQKRTRKVKKVGGQP
jgi:hypothetical protein